MWDGDRMMSSVIFNVLDQVSTLESNNGRNPANTITIRIKFRLTQPWIIEMHQAIDLYLSPVSFTFLKTTKTGKQCKFFIWSFKVRTSLKNMIKIQIEKVYVMESPSVLMLRTGNLRDVKRRKGQDLIPPWNAKVYSTATISAVLCDDNDECFENADEKNLRTATKTQILESFSTFYFQLNVNDLTINSFQFISILMHHHL